MQDFCSASEDQETELLRMFSEAWAGCIGRVKSCLLFELASIRLHTQRVPQFLQKRTHGNSFGLAEDRPIYIYIYISTFPKRKHKHLFEVSERFTLP